ncbi:YesL family protein [Bacillus sp. JCM 19034]|uniref:YesL family protein n=1 Tax=Bacillus sp. JCM 19034 TaxID=1481928 RepID=UPI000B0F46F4|nr:DUF624 domain-containing protein [Bacillus sp. JCM 19034]
MNRYYLICQWITRFVYLNILWVSFTIIGLGVFGLMPATSAMFAVVRKWVSANKDIPIFATFWRTYKTEFKLSNFAGFFFFSSGYLLIIELRILFGQEQMIYLFGVAGVVILLFVLGIIVLYFFPVFVHYELSLANYVKWPFILAMVHPLMTGFLLVSLASIYYFIYSTIPILLFLFGGSVTAISLHGVYRKRLNM